MNGERRDLWRNGSETGIRLREGTTGSREMHLTNTTKPIIEFTACQIIIQVSFEWNSKTLKRLRVTGLNVGL